MDCGVHAAVVSSGQILGTPSIEEEELKNENFVLHEGHI
jgi:hypothetical protein